MKRNQIVRAPGRTAIVLAMVLGFGFLLGWISGTSRLVPKNLDPHTTCRPSDPAVATKNAKRVVLYLGNSLVFDHDWQIEGTFPVNCAKQGRTASELALNSLPLIQPDLVVLGFGTVEYLRAEKQNRQLDFEDINQSISDVGTAVKARYPDSKVMLLGVPPLEQDGRRVDTTPLNDSFSELSDQRGFIWAPISATSLYDGIHLSRSEYDQWRNAIVQTLESPN